MARVLVALVLLAAVATAADEVRILVSDGDPVTGELEDLERLELATPWGTVAIPVADLAELSFTDGDVRAHTREGTICGRLAHERLRVRTRFGTVAVETASIGRITWTREPAAPAEGPVVVLANGSSVRGRLGATGLPLTTAFGRLEIPLARVERIRREKGRFRVLVDGDDLAGTLPDRKWTLTTRYGTLRFETDALHGWSARGAPRVGETLGGGHEVVAVARFRGRTYLLVQNPKGIDWAEASGAARALAGHLATVADREEHEFLLALARKGGRETCWIGLSDAKQEGDWKWITGEPLTFRAWNSGEPNNAGNREHGAEMILSHRDGAWNDIPLDQRNRGGCLIELDR